MPKHPFLEVKTSTIPNAGLGVFALRDIKKESVLGSTQAVASTKRLSTECETPSTRSG